MAEATPHGRLPNHQQVGVTKLHRRLHAGYAVDGISRDTLIRLVDHPELPLRIHTRDTIKAGRSALLVRGEFPIGGHMVSVAYKRVLRRNWWKAGLAWLFGNRTLRTWRMALLLDRLQIRTAQPLLVVVPRWCQPRKASYLAVQWLDGARNLTAYSDWLESLPDHESRWRLLSATESLGQLIGQMHAQRVSHRDLKAGNLLLLNRPSSVEAYVIDLDGVRRPRWLSRNRRLRDLSRLVLATENNPRITPTSRLRFLLAYLLVQGEAAESWKTWWKALRHLADKRRKQPRPSGSNRS